MKLIELNQVKKGSLIQRYSDKVIVEVLETESDNYIVKRVDSVEGESIKVNRSTVQKNYKVYEQELDKISTKVNINLDNTETMKNIVTLKELITEIGKNTERKSMILIRRKLRANESLNKYHSSGKNWEFDIEQKEEVKTILLDILK